MNETSPEFRMCAYHMEHKSKLDRNDKDHEDIWEAINRMRGWVVAASGSAIVVLIGVILQFIYLYMSRGNP